MEYDLEKSFKDFFYFSIDLIQNLNSTNNNLKFAVVNMQIALELFLKYYFLSKGKSEWLFSNSTKYEFKDFKTKLDHFYKPENSLLITKKKHLSKILEARNKIVHTGKNSWNDELAINLINTTLFIQSVFNKEFDQTMFDIFHNGNKNLSSNEVWRKGTENFAKNIADLNHQNVYECWFCFSKSLVNKELFNYEETGDKGFQCVTCLETLYEDYQIGIANCVCGEKSFVVDCLNVQNGDEYYGTCLNCDISYHTYRCDNCGKYFLDFDNERIIYESKNYCCKNCADEKKLQVTSVLQKRG